MHISSKIKYQFEVDVREFNLIKKALQKMGLPGIKLACEIEERQVKAAEKLEEHLIAVKGSNG